MFVLIVVAPTQEGYSRPASPLHTRENNRFSPRSSVLREREGERKMEELIISVVPTVGLLLLGAIIWFTDPWVREQRKKEQRAKR